MLLALKITYFTDSITSTANKISLFYVHIFLIYIFLGLTS